MPVNLTLRVLIRSIAAETFSYVAESAGWRALATAFAARDGLAIDVRYRGCADCYRWFVGVSCMQTHGYSVRA